MQSSFTYSTASCLTFQKKNKKIQKKPMGGSLSTNVYNNLSGSNSTSQIVKWQWAIDKENIKCY